MCGTPRPQWCRQNCHTAQYHGVNAATPGGCALQGTEYHGPVVVRDLGRQIQQLKEEGLTILLCEQNTKFAIALSDRAYVLEKGQVRFSGTIAELQDNEEVRRQYLAL